MIRQSHLKTPREVQAPVGSIHGVTVSLTGEAPGRPPAYLTPAGLRVPLDDPNPLLAQWAGALDVEFTSDRIAEISATRFAEEDRFVQVLKGAGWEPSVSLRDYQMAMLLRALLTTRRRAPRGGVQPTVAVTAELCAIVAAVRCPGDIAMRYSSAGPDAFLHRIAYQQFWDQEDYSSWTRGLMLQRLIAAELAKSKRGLDLSAKFHELNGLSLESFSFLTFGLFSAATAQPGRSFDESQLAGSEHFTISTREAEAFYRLVAVGFVDFALRAYDAKVFVEGFEPYAINPLTRWPVLRRPSGRHNVPIPRLLLQRASVGIYYDFMLSLKGPERDAFGNAWGNAFGAYCGEVLARTPTAGTATPAAELVRSGRRCDWIVDDGHTVVLIECKTRGLSAHTKITGSDELMRKDIVRDSGSSLAGALVQIAQSRAALRSRHGERRFVGLIATLDSVHLANDRRYLHRFIREAAEDEFGGPIDLEFQVVDAQSFERLCAQSIASRRSLGSLLGEKMEPGRFDLDLLRTDLDLGGRKVRGHPIFREVGEPLFNSLLRKYRRS